MTPPGNTVRVVEIGPDRDGQRLDNFLIAELKGVPRTLIYRIIRKGQVRVNGGRSKPMRKLRQGDSVRIPPLRTGQKADIPVPEWARELVVSAIVHKDEDLLVIDKPAGVAVHAGSGLGWGLIDVLRQTWPEEYFELVHRLDRETSGCLAVARSGQALKHFAEQFRQSEAGKDYLCLVEGRLPEAVVRVNAPLRKITAGDRRMVVVDEEGKRAITVFHLLDHLAVPPAGASYLRVELLTGRTHQIRAHARHLGLPLAGDELYGSPEALERWRRRGLNRLFLHAQRLQLTGRNGEVIVASAPLPAELAKVLSHAGG
jgi:23S rRNA pseudouridine955/2504/2580 synthase